MVEIAMPRPEYDPIEHLIGLRSFLRGLATLWLTTVEHLRYGPMKSFFKPKTVTWEYDPETRQSFHARLTALYDIVAGSPDVKTYNETIDLLLKLFHDSPYSIVFFSLFVGPDFFHLVCQREPLAILIYVYVGVVFHIVDVWWGEGVGQRIVLGLSLPAELLERCPKYVSAFLWAQRQVSETPEPDRVLFWRVPVSFPGRSRYTIY
jgi:hypothetical protein